MTTDKILLEGIKSGYHGSMRVTPVTIPADSRAEVPGSGGIGDQLLRRKTLLVQNLGGGEVYVGGDNVGFGPSHGGGDSTTCSGVTVVSGAVFNLDAGRSRIYAFNPNGFSVTIKVLEVS